MFFDIWVFRLPKLKAVVVSRGDAPPGDAGPVKVLTLEQLMEDAKAAFNSYLISI